jgi:hypothetical protein
VIDDAVSHVGRAMRVLPWRVPEMMRRMMHECLSTTWQVIANYATFIRDLIRWTT